MHLVVAIAVAFALTGDWRIAVGIGLIEPLVQTLAYVFHERVWDGAMRRRAPTGNRAAGEASGEMTGGG